MSRIRYIKLDPAEAPTPPSGYVYQGVDASGNLYTKDDAGTITIFGSPIPSQFKNFSSTQWRATLPALVVPNGTFINGFTSFDNITDKIANGTTSYDEYNINEAGNIVIPYVGKPYEGQKINILIRVNFNIDVGTVQTVRVELRRAIDDSVVGSPTQLQRNPDETGQQIVFPTYVNGIADPFVVDGFYIALVNNSGVSITVEGNAGLYIQSSFQSPLIF